MHSLIRIGGAGRGKDIGIDIGIDTVMSNTTFALPSPLLYKDSIKEQDSIVYIFLTRQLLTLLYLPWRCISIQVPIVGRSVQLQVGTYVRLPGVLKSRQVATQTALLCPPLPPTPEGGGGRREEKNLYLFFNSYCIKSTYCLFNVQTVVKAKGNFTHTHIYRYMVAISDISTRRRIAMPGIPIQQSIIDY